MDAEKFLDEVFLDFSKQQLVFLTQKAVRSTYMWSISDDGNFVDMMPKANFLVEVIPSRLDEKDNIPKSEMDSYLSANLTEGGVDIDNLKNKLKGKRVVSRSGVDPMKGRFWFLKVLDDKHIENDERSRAHPPEFLLHALVALLGPEYKKLGWVVEVSDNGKLVNMHLPVDAKGYRVFKQAYVDKASVITPLFDAQKYPNTRGLFSLIEELKAFDKKVVSVLNTTTNTWYVKIV